MLCKVREPVGGGRRISKQIRELIFQMVADNPSWGAPRIHGELLMLGFDVSETTISRWMKRAPKDPQPAKRWLAFLRNHREAIAAMDFFPVPTLTFGVLYCFFIIGHDRRRILHFNVTRHPTSTWIVQQLREAFPLRFRAQISPIRPRCEVRIGSARVDPLAEHDTGPYLDSESLAKWGRRALGRKLPPRLARPRDRLG
jgi:hypothetical protein